jgi:hypothetical protein
MMITRTLCFILIVIVNSFGAMCQEPARPLTEMTADLPDETEETSLLQKGQWQGEFAYLYTHFSKAPNPSIGQALIRYGALSRWEFRLLVEEGYARDRYLEETVQSTYPLALSTKLALLKGHPVLPDITFVGYLKLPFTAHSREQSLYWSPIVSLAFQHKLGDKWKLDYNGGGQQEPFGKNWSAFANGSIHYKISERLETFAEYYGQYQNDAQHNAGIGIFYQINNYSGIYGVGGRSIASKPYNYFFSAGLAFRWR